MSFKIKSLLFYEPKNDKDGNDIYYSVSDAGNGNTTTFKIVANNKNEIIDFNVYPIHRIFCYRRWALRP